MKRWLFMLFALVLSAPVPAHACGYWTLADHESGEKGTFHIRTSPGGFRIVGDAPRLQAYEGEDRIGFFRGGLLHWRGQRVGTLIGDQLQLGRDRFRIEITPREHDIHRWLVIVHRGTEVVAEGAAMAFCICGGCDEEWQRDDIRRRVAFYLAKRDLG